MIRETDGDMLEMSSETVAARARFVPVVAPLVERQRCTFCVMGRKRRKRKTKQTMTPRVWLDCTFVGLVDDMLVVLTLRDEESRAIEAAAVTAKGPAEAPVKIILKCLEAWGLKRTVLVTDNEPAIQALMTAVKLARHEETVVTGKSRYDSKSKGLVENAHQLLQGLLRPWVASMEKGSKRR